MKKFYFTFGNNHITKTGTSMENNFVLVYASNQDEARAKFVEQFTSIEMERPTAFAFQYDEELWNKSVNVWYPGLVPFKTIF